MPPVDRRFRDGRFAGVWQAGIGDHVIALAWSPDGTRLAAAGIEGAVRILDAATGSTRHTCAGHKTGATAVTWVDEGTVASAGQDGRVRVWDARTGSQAAALDAGAKWVERVAVSPCRSLLASAAGKKVRLWGRGGNLLRDYPEHASTVTDLAWRPGTPDVSASAYGGVTVWSPHAAEPADRFEWRGSVLRVAWSPNGRFLAAGGQDRTVHFWVVDQRLDLTMSGYLTKVNQLAWDHASRYLATGMCSRVTVWDCVGPGPGGTTPLALDAHDAAADVTALAFQHRSGGLASGGGDGRVFLWRPGRGARPFAGAALDDAVTQLAWAADDVRLAAGTNSGAVAVLELVE